MGRDGKLGFKKNHEVYNTRDLATSPSLPNMTSTISASVVHYNSVRLMLQQKCVESLNSMSTDKIIKTFYQIKFIFRMTLNLQCLLTHHQVSINIWLTIT